jgi:hypothetical protein
MDPVAMILSVSLTIKTAQYISRVNSIIIKLMNGRDIIALRLVSRTYQIAGRTHSPGYMMHLETINANAKMANVIFAQISILEYLNILATGKNGSAIL